QNIPDCLFQFRRHNAALRLRIALQSRETVAELRHRLGLVFRYKVGVANGHINSDMAHQILHSDQIHPRHNEMRGESMPQVMETEVRDSRLSASPLKSIVNRCPAEWFTPWPQEEQIPIAVLLEPCHGFSGEFIDGYGLEPKCFGLLDRYQAAFQVYAIPWKP